MKVWAEGYRGTLRSYERLDHIYERRVRSSMPTGARPVTAPSLRVPGREGLGVCGWRRGMGNFGALDSHGFGLVRQIWNASPASRAYSLPGLLTLDQIQNSTTFSDGIQGPEFKLTFKAVPQAPGGMPLQILPRIEGS
jgi:hypothetical protein